MSHTNHAPPKVRQPVTLAGGALIQVDPTSPLWTQGARWGAVIRTRKTEVLVHLGKLGRLWVPSDHVMEC